jgi:tetratricopeptide (TPR) repeat protein
MFVAVPRTEGSPPRSSRDVFLAAGLALLVFAPLFAQTPDPAYLPLSKAYEEAARKQYDAAIADFLTGIAAAPDRAAPRKDLAYTYLKIGENDLAREQFGEAMRIDPKDTQVAMEYAFLCYESKRQAEARRIFDRIRKTGNAVAEQAFQNIDRPLEAGIERWKQAIAMGADNFNAHFELASLAEQRDEPALAAEHYEKAWRLKPEQRYVLVDLGRVWKSLGRNEDAMAALMAASRGGEARAAEMARELMPQRYPYVSEFQKALALDAQNGELRREFAYLLLKMERPAEAEEQFRILVASDPKDLLSATQLGFLLYGRGEHAAAQPLFDRVLAGNDEELANRVRAVLRMPQVLKSRVVAAPTSIDAKVMAERSIQAGYLKDALQYLRVAHEADPSDFQVMLKLGWALNLLHQDREAVEWFGLARKSSDSEIAGEAEQGWENLSRALERIRVSGWLYPVYSSRWRDVFGYSQVRAEVRTGFHIEPYVSVRVVGDTRQSIGTVTPQYLSESSVIGALGVQTDAWHGMRAWFEVGSAFAYLKGTVRPDYRGGISGTERIGRIADTTLDALYISQFDKDFLVYSQNRLGYLGGPLEPYWNLNLVFDARGQDWANIIETGPGIRFLGRPLPRATWVRLDVLRGKYRSTGAAFTDMRAGFWYAFTR